MERRPGAPAIGYPADVREQRMINLEINGKAHALDLDPNTPLLWVIRDHVGLTGTRFGCGMGLCGACTVHWNGMAVRSCVLPISAVSGAKITTIEGLAHPVQETWVEHQVPQCGYCQSGQIMAAAALLAENPHPTDDNINEYMTNLCRCATYQRIRKAIHATAAKTPLPPSPSAPPALDSQPPGTALPGTTVVPAPTPAGGAK